MGCGGSKDTVQTSPQAKQTRKENTSTKQEGTKEPTRGRARPSSAPPTNRKADKSRANKSKERKEAKDGEDFDDRKIQPSKEDQLRQELVLAADSRDMDRLERAIAEYDHHVQLNCAELARARRVLLSLHEQKLQEAIQGQKLEELEEAIDAATSSAVSPELHDSDTLKEAEALRNVLRRLKLYLHKVLELKPMTVSEIHSYKRPRPLVHAVMKATYLLLGEQERLLQQWEYIQSLLRRQGRGSIIRRIKEFDPQHMKKAKVHRAEDHLKYCSKDKVRQTSAGAGTFFVWSYNIIKEGKSMENGKN